MTVLIITRSDDNECIDNVMKAIEQKGGQAFRFDTDCFPTDIRLTAKYGSGGEVQTLASADHQVDLRDVTAVWYRRTRFGGQIPKSLDKQYRQASVGETRATVLGLLSAMDAFCMDPLPVIRHAGNKQLQLRTAREVGLAIPRTLVTNDPDVVRTFAGECRDGMVTKMQYSFAIFDDEGRESVVFTTAMKPADLEDLSGLDLCPMMFQETVPKAHELRVTIVGNRVFAASIDSQSLKRAKIDWRREGQQLVDQWNKYDLPGEVETKLLHLMDRLDLNYGAIDIVVTPDDRYIFLEINPVGEFFWLEIHPGFAISDAIADVLLGKCARRAGNNRCQRQSR
ncbi:MAG: MvdD family ATP-grasp ribosomal peptide maturase [Planctomycetes bacterium]|nr:MvdD family ATP-grasp ribosomal peptide maturase [Planctomycetota bacterium]